MMQQYMEIKSKYKDCILFFRLGDFYEMFFEDAEIASKELEIALTGRDCGLEERAPMCGVPFHAADTYIAKLINKGYKVAICEQVEDPAVAKGIVRRDVIRIITPGTVTDSSMLDERRNNYLMSIHADRGYYGIAIVDITTGEFLTTSIIYGNTEGKLYDEIAKYAPSEIILSCESDNYEIINNIKKRYNNIYISVFDQTWFEGGTPEKKLAEKFGQKKCETVGMLSNYSVYASGILLEYLERTQKVNLEHIQDIKIYRIDEYMILDETARRNLELTETMREKKRKGSLLNVMDRTVTSMGGRMIRKWIEQPLININDINSRLDAVSELKEKFMLRMEIRELLKKVYDMERLIGKVVLGNANCRDLIALKNSTAQLPYIKELMSNCTSSLLVQIYEKTDTLDDICELIEKSIVDDPPVTIKEGGIIKTGYNEEVDRLRKASTEGKSWVAALENSERERTGIKNLKVGFNKVFGYYLEVTKSHLSLVPDNYIRKQTLANCERYITDELKKIEDSILGAEEKVVQLEYEIFMEIRNKISQQTGRIKNTALQISMLDALCSLAELADRENYCMPVVDSGDAIEIIDGRHPVVEKMMDYGTFVPNDTILDMDENRFLIITGPNMAGKSTYMRQTALIVLMAQIGSFVPAGRAHIGIVDRIFTRVGASDDLASGQSTFMVEMSEVADILNNATPRSLLILDEIGRGTSTYDGLSIAWAVTEFIANKEKMGCRTLFATHYHELTELEGKLPGIKNYCISVQEKGDDIIFLRKIIRGGADESYGVQVAKLAGIPVPIIERAKEILKELEDSDISRKVSRLRRGVKPAEGQIDIFSFMNTVNGNNEVLEELKNIDIREMTPIDALNCLYKLQQKVKKGI